MVQVTISSDNSYNRNMLPYVMRARIYVLLDSNYFVVTRGEIV